MRIETNHQMLSFGSQHAVQAQLDRIHAISIALAHHFP